jgi:hypothetical protein
LDGACCEAAHPRFPPARSPDCRPAAVALEIRNELKIDRSPADVFRFLTLLKAALEGGLSLQEASRARSS